MATQSILAKEAVELFYSSDKWKLWKSNKCPESLWFGFKVEIDEVPYFGIARNSIMCKGPKTKKLEKCIKNLISKFKCETFTLLFVTKMEDYYEFERARNKLDYHCANVGSFELLYEYTEECYNLLERCFSKSKNVWKNPEYEFESELEDDCDWKSVVSDSSDNVSELGDDLDDFDETDGVDDEITGITYVNNMIDEIDSDCETNNKIQKRATKRSRNDDYNYYDYQNYYDYYDYNDNTNTKKHKLSDLKESLFYW